MRVGLTRGRYYVADSTLQQLLLAITVILPVLATAAVPPGAWIAPSRCSLPISAFSASQRRGQGTSAISKWMLPTCPFATSVLDPSSSSRVSTALELSPLSDTNLILAETESWREYVPLVVSLFVIVDILLGSPAANSVLGLMRPKEEGTSDDDEGQATRSSNPFSSLMQGLPRGQQQDGNNNNKSGRGGRNSNKERIDTKAVAQAALDKASATKELRKFLDESKSDWDKMRDIQQKMDNDLAQFDENIRRQRTEWDKEINKDAKKS